MSLSDLAQTFAALEDAAQKRPLDFFRWLPGQRAFLEATGPRVLLRGGNQWLGKTTVGVAELWYRLTGEHPYKPVRSPPITALVITATHEQGQNIQRRIWDLCDSSALTPDTVWDPAKGAFRGKYPRLRLKNGSECMFRSGRGSFTPAVQAKAQAISVHDELEESLRLLAAAEEDAAPVVTDDAAIGMILKAIEGLPVSVLEQIRAAIDRQL